MSIIDVLAIPNEENKEEVYKKILKKMNVEEYRDSEIPAFNKKDGEMHFQNVCFEGYKFIRQDFLCKYKYSPILFHLVTKGNVHEKVVEFLNSISSGISFKLVTDSHTLVVDSGFYLFTGRYANEDDKKYDIYHLCTKFNSNLVEISVDTECLDVIPYAEYIALCILRIFHSLEMGKFYRISLEKFQETGMMFESISLDDFWGFTYAGNHGLYDSRIGKEGEKILKEKFNELLNIQNYVNYKERFEITNSQTDIIQKLLDLPKNNRYF